MRCNRSHAGSDASWLRKSAQGIYHRTRKTSLLVSRHRSDDLSGVMVSRAFRFRNFSENCGLVSFVRKDERQFCVGTHQQNRQRTSLISRGTGPGVYLARVSGPKGKIQGCISSSLISRFRLQKQPGWLFIDAFVTSIYQHLTSDHRFLLPTWALRATSMRSSRSISSTGRSATDHRVPTRSRHRHQCGR